MNNGIPKWEKWYAALKAVEPEAYHKALEYGQGVALNHNLPESGKLGADIEVACVMLACELLGVHP